MIFTDDQGYADLSIQKQVDDIKTPYIDSLAINGVQFTDGILIWKKEWKNTIGIQ